jgi:DNA-binding MarR family transcriptional regulator
MVDAEGTDTIHDNTIQHVLFQAAREVRGALEHELASHGITAQQASLAGLLRAWKRKQRPSRLQIAARLGTDGAGMTRLIDRLEKKGVVVRMTGEGDRRLVVVELTDTGQAIAARAEPAFEHVNRRLLAGFSEAEVTQLRAMLSRLRENARKMPA